MTAAYSRLVALAGLAGLLVLILRPPDAAALAGAAPLAALLATGIRPRPRWAIATAIVMLPYFSYGVMAVLTAPERRTRAVLFAVLTVVVFLAALDSMRRRQPLRPPPPAPSARKE